MQNYLRHIGRFERSQGLTLFFDLILLCCSLLLSFAILHEFSLTQLQIDQYIHFLPIFLLVQCLFLRAFGVYRSIWRYSGTSDVLLIIQAVLLNLVCWILFQVVLGTYLVSPRLIDKFHTIIGFLTNIFFVGFNPEQVKLQVSILIINAILSVMTISGMRMLGRIWIEMKRREENPALKRLLLIGSENESEGVLREMKRSPNLPYEPVGIITTQPERIGLRIHGVKILGQLEDLPRIIKQQKIDEILIALPAHSGKIVRQVISLCEPMQVKIRTLPAMEELLEGKLKFSQFPEIRPEDLLGREQFAVDTVSIAAYLSQKTILVTGAGGSIGSEICRQICQYNPALLILLGSGENSIYEIEMELRQRYPLIKLQPVIANIQDRSRLEQIFKQYQPSVVFHAAAHKHVPMMELNPGEAIKNNVLGTRNVAETAIQFSATHFILISTDKAINPTNVMGAAKRLAELVIENIAKTADTRFAIVRFGNVLGSRGSVIPLFQQQILRGGPVTVTHPDVARYFMSIPEAVKLVIQTGALGQNGEIYALEMGEPIKIVELARNLITLAGLEPDTDIEIKFTGMRPGEKIFEISPTEGEGVKPTRFPSIFQIPSDSIDANKLQPQLNHLSDWLKSAHSTQECLQTLTQIIQTSVSQ